MFERVRKMAFLVLAAGVLAACSPAADVAVPTQPAATEAAAAPTMDPGTDGGMEMGDAPAVPAGLAYAEGEEIRFIHTETSDAEIATLLTNMMASQVLHVPSLSEIPESATAVAYVFANGLEGTGPLGFQPDVFDNPPGSAGYTPLRRLHVVTWVDPAQAVLLTSAAAVLEAGQSGLVTIEVKPVIVNMPFLTWPGGTR
jgi:hypothetical protein